jgi:hypothetical protein
MAQPNVITRSLIPAVATAIATSQSPAAGAITLTSPVVTLDTQRRVVITSGGNDSGINFTVFGTNQVGAPIQDTFAGGNGTTSVGLSNLDFLTVNAITHSGSVASTLTAGTGNTGSSLWQIVNWNPTPVNIGYVVEQRTGTSTFTLDLTLDDPNILPGTGGLNAAGLAFPFASPFFASTGTTTLTMPIVAWRLTTNAGTGTLVVRSLQAGLGSP